MSAVIIQEDFNAQIVRVVEDYLRQRGVGGSPNVSQNSRQRSVHYAITNAAIAAATNALTSPSTAEVEILSRNSSGDLERSGIKHTLTHRYEHISVDANVLVVITRLNGEWKLGGADCAAMGSPPA